MLCVTNMLLHNIEDPSFVRHDNTLARPYISWGAEDRVIPPAPGATMIEGAGHMPHMERAAEVAARLKAHLEAHP